ncbi:MAG: DUF1998 domain-containing protein [Ignavibacterium sp.]
MSDELMKEILEIIKNLKPKNVEVTYEKKKLTEDEFIEINHPLITDIFFYVDKVTNYVPKFRLKYVGQSPNFKESVATIDDIDEKGNPIKKPLGPVGFSYETQILSFAIKRKIAEERILGEESIGTIKNDSVVERLISSLVTMSYALKKAVCILQACNVDDVETAWTIYKDCCYLFLFDNSEGGNGIAHLAFLELKEDLKSQQDLMETRLFKQISEILKQRCCPDVCEECLLLPRTPNHIVGLLNKRLGRTVLLGESN